MNKVNGSENENLVHSKTLQLDQLLERDMKQHHSVHLYD